MNPNAEKVLTEENSWVTGRIFLVLTPSILDFTTVLVLWSKNTNKERKTEEDYSGPRKAQGTWVWIFDIIDNKRLFYGQNVITSST